MADKNNNDSVFQWNFNLEDSDSDFTDIDFTSGNNYEPSDKDIQPVIFVRDETAKKKTSDGVKPAAAENKNAAEYRPATAKKNAAPKKTAAANRTSSQKKKKGGTALNWKLIALIAGAVIVVALLVVLITRCGKKEEKAWTAVEAESDVKKLMDSYFAAKEDGDATAMRKVLVADSVVNASVLGVESTIYKSYSNINLQQYPGINKNEYVICADYDTDLVHLEGASVPTLSWFYALPDEKGELRLMTTSEMKAEGNSEIYNYVTAAAALLSDTTVAAVQARTNEVVGKNSRLKQYLENIKEGKYYEVPPEDGTDTPDTTVPASTEETVPDTTVDPAIVTSNFMYVNAGTLNMRNAPSADGTVIWRFTRGWCLTVIGEEGNWYKVRDDVQTNPGSGNGQDCQYYEGYVSKDYIVAEYSQIQW